MWRDEPRNWHGILTHCISFVGCGAGAALYLLFLWWQFGNPFTLIPKIQMSSWGYYHQPVSFIDFITFKQFLGHVGKVIQYGVLEFDDPGSTNLLCLVLGVASAVFSPFYFKKNPIMRWAFPLYFLLVYYSSIGGTGMGSLPRFLMPMLPLYFGFYELCKYTAKKTKLAAGIGLAALIVAGSLFLLGNYMLRFALGWPRFF